MPIAMRAGELRVRLPGVSLGEHCVVRAGVADASTIGHAVVTRIEQDIATLSLVGSAGPPGAGSLVAPTGQPLQIGTGRHLLGTVLDGFGDIVERLDGAPVSGPTVQREPVTAPPIDFRERRAVVRPFPTGIRAVDGLLTVGEGQRVGIFAAAGSGKTTLVEMLLESAHCDVRVVALIGERGREVTAFVDTLRASAVASRTIIVQATSDTSPATRVNAAMVAARIAESFRRKGSTVLLVMDSVTRYARALRDMALSAGEPPARRGYPASVFEALPRLVERPGNTREGSITAFYTVLMEEEGEADPIAEEVKSLLDGHIQLAGRLAQRGHFPAIDVLRSTSRLFLQLADARQQDAAARVRELLGRLEDLQLLRDIGEYQPGVQPEQDMAIAKEKAVHAYLRQGRHEQVALQQGHEALNALAR